jgi:hypothetical protein
VMTLLGRPYLVISRLATPQTHNGRAWWRSAREPWGVGQAALRGLLSCSPRLEIYSLNPLSSCSASLPRNTSPTHDAAVSEGGAWLGLVIRRLVRCPPCPSKLTPFGQLDKLVISQLGLLAQRRLARGVKLNHAEATVGVVLSRPDCPSLTICRL